ncbi:uncharacterized protein LOC123545730 [Mercenaria mercenaria]|uniref:uncharacterized protein LOC123545730 n=1 Tax=Mercenaria mercenaria TaxID=6596 RepID=UPI001E1DED85|nr:uncharacterized protein LOC123545730 [Mercenaria mercenaria]
MVSTMVEHSTGLYAKLALGLLSISTLFAWIAYTCTGWGEAVSGPLAGTHYGLWRVCSDNKYTPGCVTTDGWANDWYAASQALVTFGFFGINAALVLQMVYMFKPGCVGSIEVAVPTALICFITGLLYLIGIIVYGAKFGEDFVNPADSDPNWGEYKLGYSFALSVVALVFELVAGLLLILDAKANVVNTCETSARSCHT